MAKSKSSTKVTARRTAAKARSRKGPAEPAAAVADNPPAARQLRIGPVERSRPSIIGLLQRKQGASLAELVAATGWLPHTTRAALTRLRQGGHDLQKEKRDTGETAYRIAARPAWLARARPPDHGGH